MSLLIEVLYLESQGIYKLIQFHVTKHFELEVGFVFLDACLFQHGSSGSPWQKKQKGTSAANTKNVGGNPATY